MTNFPTSIDIMGHEIQIELVEGLKNEDGQSLYGECDDAEKVIRICSISNKTQKKRLETLFHEICHMVLNLSGVAYMLDEEGKQEEAIVRALENGLGPIVTFKRKFEDD